MHSCLMLNLSVTRGVCSGAQVEVHYKEVLYHDHSLLQGEEEGGGGSQRHPEHCRFGD